MAHTPGPWRCPYGGVGIYAGDNMEMIANVGRLHGPGRGDETTANIALICLAPDLLAAARNALQVARDPWNYTEMEQIAILDAVEAVIDRAEGRE